MMAGTEDLFSFHTPKNLQAFLEKNSLEAMIKLNRDLVILIDGPEGSGKSTWAFQRMYDLNPEAFATTEKFLSRVAFTPEEFFNMVRTVKNGVVVFDEAFRGFSSRSSLSKVNRKLVQALMEMRQNNNIVFIVLPSFFLLDIYPAMLRSNYLFNIYFQINSKKRSWRGYNKGDKNKIYQIGIKKGWTYPFDTPFKGYFYGKFPGGDEYRRAYEEKKSKSLVEMDKEPTKMDLSRKLRHERDVMIRVLNKQGISQTKIIEIVGEEAFKLSVGKVERAVLQNP